MEFDGKKMKSYRKTRTKLSMDAIAAKLDISRQAVQRWEAGTAKPRNGEVLQALADVLGCKLSDICNGVPDAPGPAIADSLLQLVVDYWECLTGDEKLKIGNLVAAARDREKLKAARKKNAADLIG